MKKIFAFALATLLMGAPLVSLASTINNAPVEVFEGDDKKKKKKEAEAKESETKKEGTTEKSCAPKTTGKSCCSHGAAAKSCAPKKEL